MLKASGEATRHCSRPRHSQKSHLNHVNHNHQPSPELQPFASPLDAHPPEVQKPFQFLPATAMHEAGKFELVSLAEVEGQRSEKLIMSRSF